MIEKVQFGDPFSMALNDHNQCTGQCHSDCGGCWGPGGQTDNKYQDYQLDQKQEYNWFQHNIPKP
jgi:hypothetical protein